MKVGRKIQLLFYFAAFLAVVGVFLVHRFLQEEPRVMEPPTYELDQIPDYILSVVDKKKIVRSINTYEYSIDRLETFARLRAYSLTLALGDSLVIQYFDRTYDLKSWDHERTISEEDEPHFVCEITVRNNPLPGDENIDMSFDSYRVTGVKKPFK